MARYFLYIFVPIILIRKILASLGTKIDSKIETDSDTDWSNLYNLDHNREPNYNLQCTRTKIKMNHNNERTVSRIAEIQRIKRRIEARNISRKESFRINLKEKIIQGDFNVLFWDIKRCFFKYLILAVTTYIPLIPFSCGMLVA